MPAAIAAQNRRRSSRPATTGRPGDNNSARPDRSERRLCFLIATPPFKVLRRSFESSQYTSIEFGKRCRDAGVRPSMGSVGDAYDNAMCESFFATLECELLARCRFKTPAEARRTVFAFIEGFYNPCRRHSSIGYLSPIDYEHQHHAMAVVPDPSQLDAVLAPVKDASCRLRRSPAAILDRRCAPQPHCHAGRDGRMAPPGDEPKNGSIQEDNITSHQTA